jgi:hypothetical protein
VASAEAETLQKLAKNFTIHIESWSVPASGSAKLRWVQGGLPVHPFG